MRLVNNGKTWNSYYGLTFWDLRSWMENEARLAMKEIGGKQEEHGGWEDQGRRTRMTSRGVLCTIYKMAPACRTSGKGGRQRETSIHAAWEWRAVVRNNWKEEWRNGKKKGKGLIWYWNEYWNKYWWNTEIWFTGL